MSQTEYPELSGHHLIEGSRLFANRSDLIRSLPIAADGTAVIAEVGVEIGNFSEFMLDVLKPRLFVAIDYFNLDKLTTHLWGTVPVAVAFDGLSHKEFYQRRFSSYGGVLRIEQGDSHECLARYNSPEFDLIYIDANHTY